LNNGCLSVVPPSPAPAVKDADEIGRKRRHRARDAAGDVELVALAHRLIHRASGYAAGRTGVEPDVLLDLEVDGVRCVLIAAPAPPDAAHQLSPREQEIVRMVSHGYPTKTIAAVLEISTWTVSTHLRRIFAKLGVRTRAAMVARALEEGLAPEPGELDPSRRLG
jgi:DNA-binding CsgD family transcriptional regulator